MRGVLGLAVLLTLPGCGPPLADPEQFCEDRGVSSCYRDRLAMRTTQDQYVACASAVTAMCDGATFAAGCAVPVDAADACIAALRDESRIGTPTSMLVECSAEALCH